MSKIIAQLEVSGETVGAFVRRLAREHRVKYVETPLDGLANKFSQLSDAEVDLDDVELLLIALRRAGVIAKSDVTPLQARHLREQGYK